MGRALQPGQVGTRGKGRKVEREGPSFQLQGEVGRAQGPCCTVPHRHRSLLCNLQNSEVVQFSKKSKNGRLLLIPPAPATPASRRIRAAVAKET